MVEVGASAAMSGPMIFSLAASSKKAYLKSWIVSDRQVMGQFENPTAENARLVMRRFRRLTNAFSKKLENHASAIALYFMYHNFAEADVSLEGMVLRSASGAIVGFHIAGLTALTRLRP